MNVATLRPMLGDVRQWLPLATLVTLCVVVGVVGPGFLRIGNLLQLAGDTAVLFILATGVTFVIMLGGIDLSIQAMASLSSVVMALTVDRIGYGAFALALALGGIVGFLSGLAHVRLRIPSFIATLATGGVLSSAALVISHERSITLGETERSYQTVIAGSVMDIPNVIVIGFVVLAIAHLLQGHTCFGRYSAAIGAGEPAAYASGVKADRQKVIAFTLSATFAALAGVVLSARLASGSPTLAAEMLLPSIAAVVVGGTAITDGVGGGLYNPFYTAVLEQFTVKLQQIGDQVLLVHVDSDHAVDAVVSKLASYRVDAVVSALAVLSPYAAQTLATLKIPVICFNTAVKNDWVRSVSTDNAQAGRAIADLFVAKGARSFGFISGPQISFANRGRMTSFVGRLRELGAGPVAIAQGDYRYEGGFAAALKLFGKARKPEAPFCANDLLAIGAMDALRKTFGVRVPEDVMVAGFDDIQVASWAAYDLTTFAQDAAQMVDEALAVLTAAATGSAIRSGDPVIVPARLVECGTT